MNLVYVIGALVVSLVGLLGLCSIRTHQLTRNRQILRVYKLWGFWTVCGLTAICWYYAKTLPYHDSWVVGTLHRVTPLFGDTCKVVVGYGMEAYSSIHQGCGYLVEGMDFPVIRKWSWLIGLQYEGLPGVDDLTAWDLCFWSNFYIVWLVGVIGGFFTALGWYSKLIWLYQAGVYSND